jgi:uncharacterized protein (DUF885 family)
MRRDFHPPNRPQTLGLVLAFVVGSGCATLPNPAPSAGDSVLARGMFAEVTDEFEDRVLMTRVGLRATHSGLDSSSVARIGFMPDLSRQRAQLDGRTARILLREIDDVNVDALSQRAYVDLRTIQWDLEEISDLADFYWLDFSFISPLTTPLHDVTRLLRAHPFAGKPDADRFLELMAAIPGFIDSLQSGLETRRARGNVLPKEAIPRIVRVLRHYQRSPAESPFAVGPSRLEGLDNLTRDSLMAKVRVLIGTRVDSSLTRLITYLEGPYAAQASSKLGLWQYVGGKRYYEQLVRRESTLDATPEEMHRIGLDELLQIEENMARIRRRLGFTGSRSEFHARLRGEPRFAVIEPDTLAKLLAAHVARIRPRLDSIIRRVPRSPVGMWVLRTELPWLAPARGYIPSSPGDTIARYIIMAASVPLDASISAAAVAFRDLIPGRHIQRALQLELDSLGFLRRVARYAGLEDGWAEYAASLAGEHGMYEDPYDAYGRLLQEMRSACLLVVDTGINMFGWTRQQALDFLSQHILANDEELEEIVLRVAIDAPGSGVAATMGARELAGMREWAERELGSHFRAPAFHDEILSLGAVPLPVLGAHLEWWLWRERSRLESDTTKRR